MPLASSGGLSSLLGRQASHLAQAPNIPSHRSIHISSFIPRPQPRVSSSTAGRLLRTTRGLLQAFVGHLTTPGTLRVPGAGNGFHHAVANATRGPTIRQGLSLPARIALSKPLGAPMLPRAPVVPRSIAQVGLGTARNFSTGRPIFQHLAENVPMTGRALSEADWDVRKREEQRLRFGKAKKAEKAKGKQAVKAEKAQFHPAAASSVSEPQDDEAEFDHYFPAAPTAGVTTYLLIPLAPTPSSRLPLHNNPSSSTKHPLLPISALSELHYDHHNHALRVSSLFARLDASRVWDSGVACDVYGGPDGTANIMRICFSGWDANKVRGVIGESGTGWCALEEVREGEEGAETELEDVLSQLSAEDFSSRAETERFEDNGIGAGHIDPAQSFVLPTLDFSASFPASPPASISLSDFPSGASTPISDIDMYSHTEAWSEGISDGSGSWVEPPSVSAARMPLSPSASAWMGFSSSFTERMEGPREVMF
ncbi:hypothetical protein DENSPDRAFT_571300 [Dentipellis sp. KUC8613]|nr:hypothetical protein DENSPDRAFT_571300 [Dentipellis sp. KUC8613]